MSTIAVRTPLAAATTTASETELIAEVANLREAVGALRERVSDLEAELAKNDASRAAVGQTIKAPFTVISNSGKPIFTVSDAAFGGSDNSRVYIGRGLGGDNYGLFVKNNSGGLAIGLGEAKAGGSGVLEIRSATTATTLSRDGLIVLNSALKQIVHLGPDPTNQERAQLTLRGSFAILNPKFETIIDGGVLPDGRGTIRTWPNEDCRTYAGLRPPPCLMGATP